MDRKMHSGSKSVRVILRRHAVKIGIHIFPDNNLYLVIVIIHSDSTIYTFYRFTIYTFLKVNAVHQYLLIMELI